MIPVCDTARNCTRYVDRLVALGYRAVGRYYTRAKDWRTVTVEELAALAVGGLEMFAIFQHRANRITEFSRVSAEIDGQAAIKCANAVGHPRGLPIYFAVDMDVVPSELERIVDYFSILMGMMTVAGFRCGAYGSGLVLRTLLEKNLIERAMLANATGWQGSKDFTGWHIKQGREHRPFAGDEFPLDGGEARSLERAGSWLPFSGPQP